MVGSALAQPPHLLANTYLEQLAELIAPSAAAWCTVPRGLQSAQGRL